MAEFFPALSKIKNSPFEHPTEAELKMLGLLEKLDDDFKVFYQPAVSFDHPDFVIAHPRNGVLIIEVKDYSLATMELHEYDDRGDSDKYSISPVGKNNIEYVFPFAQVVEYKDDFFDQVVPGLTYLRAREKNAYGCVRACVYFANSDKNDVKNLFGSIDKLDADSQKYGPYDFWLCRDDDPCLAKKVAAIMRPVSLVTTALYDEIIDILTPSTDVVDAATHEFTLDEVQSKCAESKPGIRSMIRGAAGSGKTMVVSQKAINCYLDQGNVTRAPVLILTYNVTLTHYILSKIVSNTSNMIGRERDLAFNVIHFDRFLDSAIRMMGILGPSRSNYKDEYGKVRWKTFRQAQMDLIIKNKNLVPYYYAVIVDEAQDFHSEWFSFLEKTFAQMGKTELFVAIDEKQNIYGSGLMDDKKKIKIPGFSAAPCTELKKSYRMVEGNHALAVEFQREFLKDRYEVEKDVDTLQLTSWDFMGIRRFYDISSVPSHDHRCEAILEILRKVQNGKPPVSLYDMCILGSKYEFLRLLDKHLRDHDYKTRTTFETQDQYDDILKKWSNDDKIKQIPDEKRREKIIKSRVNMDTSEIRSVNKSHFWLEPDRIKMNTIHSFKGWECETVVLLLGNLVPDDLVDEPGDEPHYEELFYSAVTRSKMNLIVINMDNNRFTGFFRKLCESQNVVWSETIASEQAGTADAKASESVATDSLPLSDTKAVKKTPFASAGNATSVQPVMPVAATKSVDPAGMIRRHAIMDGNTVKIIGLNPKIESLKLDVEHHPEHKAFIGKHCGDELKYEGHIVTVMGVRR